MLKRIWFPGLCAIIIVGLVYWFFMRPHAPAVPPAIGTQTPAAAASVSNTPNTPETSSNPAQTINQPNTQTTMPDQNITSATLHTNMGDITFSFNPSTPKTVANFIKLASSGFYDSTKFHRVIKGFMDQGGDPLTKNDARISEWGTGGPGYQFADEINSADHNTVGTVAMANAGPNTNGSQFFINATDNAFLDGHYTVFGKVTAGLDVALAINAVKTDSSDRPVTPVVIESVTLK